MSEEIEIQLKVDHEKGNEVHEDYFFESAPIKITVEGELVLPERFLLRFESWRGLQLFLLTEKGEQYLGGAEYYDREKNCGMWRRVDGKPLFTGREQT